MELRDYIEAGILRKNGQKALAAYLGLDPNNITGAKAHRRGLPADACVKLSQLLNVPLETIIAASELVTERKAEKREFWRPFVENAPQMAKAASYALILTTVTNIMTATDAQSAPLRALAKLRFILC